MANNKMRVMQIDTDATDNGKGLRTVIYVSGCWQACAGCHNETSWDESAGVEMAISEIVEIVRSNPLADVTISGGDPLTFQYAETVELVRRIKEETSKNIWLYTGYTYEQVKKMRAEVLPYIDVLVDGRFEKDKRDLTTVFRGSTNQRLIDVKKSEETGALVTIDL